MALGDRDESLGPCHCCVDCNWPDPSGLCLSVVGTQVDGSILDYWHEIATPKKTNIRTDSSTGFGYPFLPYYIPAPTNGYIYGRPNGNPLLLLLSGTREFEDGTSVCYRFAMPFWIECVGGGEPVGDVPPPPISYRLKILYPKDIITVFALNLGSTTGAGAVLTCLYETIGTVAGGYGWGSYFDIGGGLTYFTTGSVYAPPCDGSERGHKWVYGFSDSWLNAAQTGVLSFDFGTFTGCPKPCSQVHPSRELNGPYTQQVRAGDPVAITNPMDLEIVVPGSWFTIPFCDPVYFDDWLLKIHLESPTDDVACSAVEVGGCLSPIFPISNWCPPNSLTTTTSTTTTTTTSSTTTTTTTTSGTETTSSTTTTTTTTSEGPADTRVFCCGEGTVFTDQLQLLINITVNGLCDCLHTGVGLVWAPGENAYTASFVLCGNTMTAKVYCVPDGGGGGSWWAELLCIDTTIAVFELTAALCIPGQNTSGTGAIFVPSACCAAEGASVNFVVSRVD